jgi:NAD(P)-dependent dehydrogenase (short-subunit alcohol dehydrogenase family)
MWMTTLQLVKLLQRSSPPAGIDIWVNNAGIIADGWKDSPLSEFRRLMDTNYFGALRRIRAEIPACANTVAVTQQPHFGHRRVSRGKPPTQDRNGDWRRRAKHWPKNFKRFGIQVSIVEPGVLATPIFDEFRDVPADTRYPPEQRINALYDAALKNKVSPLAIAQKILEIVKRDVGSFAIGLVPTRKD